MGKHAFLIIAHNDLPLLNNLIKCLDDSRNSIFLHLDIKSKINYNDIIMPQKATIKFIKRVNVSWGGDSLIKIEMKLMKEAINSEKYDYYHMISGQDLPLKNQNEFHNFFEKNHGKSYIEFDSKFAKNEFDYRIGKYYFFQNYIGKNKKTFFNVLNSIFMKIQRIIKINRITKCPYKLYKGSNWFSITDKMARYVLSKEKDIKKYFYKGFCADEIFLQTILKNSKYSKDIINNDLREINWKNKTPHIYKISDLNQLLSSKKLFGRKFSTEIDSKIIRKICIHNGINYY